MTERQHGKIVALAAGGTGGHMFPAQALARALLGRGSKVALVTDRRGSGFGGDLPEVQTARISAGPLAGGSARLSRTPAVPPATTAQARRYTGCRPGATSVPSFSRRTRASPVPSSPRSAPTRTASNTN